MEIVKISEWRIGSTVFTRWSDGTVSANYIGKNTMDLFDKYMMRASGEKKEQLKIMKSTMEQQFKDYYNSVIVGDAVCTVTESQFVEQALDLDKEGLEAVLVEFTGLPTSIEIEKVSMIQQAQKLGQTTFEVAIAE
ncbi:hypothetical protein [Enterovibrio norvegicus]|uniref:Uncharacterized protein n=1 Tax=Enterovibrio norvegicus TaxID=188144 RepID=A0ABV4L7X7_9GAMM